VSLADWGKVLFPHLVFKANVTALAVDYMKNRHITVPNGRRREKMPVNDALGTRMKTYYEQVPKTRLVRRMPVAIRIDGKAFHTFTRGFQKPFDEVLGNAMVRTMEYLCKNIQGCVFGYTQSDEITLLLIDYQTLDTDAWFEYEVQKMCSISASMATMAFNKYFYSEVLKWYDKTIADNIFQEQENVKLMKTYQNAAEKGAMFDSRVFNIPKEEACNLVYWRQLDATRNSIQMVGQANFSHSELQGCSCNVIQDMLHEQRGINWNDFPTRWKRGTAWTRARGVDYEMPILKGEDRKYVDKVIYVGEGM
jgi:tRNA(His) 5'-end guanylyltransferase